MNTVTVAQRLYTNSAQSWDIKFNRNRFVPDLDDIVCFEDLMKEEEQQASAMPDETVAAARFVSVSR